VLDPTLEEFERILGYPLVKGNPALLNFFCRSFENWHKRVGKKGGENKEYL